MAIKRILMAICFFGIASCGLQDCKKDYINSTYFSENYPNISFGVLSSAKTSNLDDNILLCFNEKKYTNDSIEKSLNISLSDSSSFQNVEEFIEKQVIESLLKTIPGKPGDNSDWSKRRFLLEFITKDIKISEEEARDYLKRNWIWFDGADFEQIANQITILALDDKKQNYFDNYIGNAGKSARVIVSKSWVDTISPSLYSHPVYYILKNGKPSIVIFSYGCCRPDVMAPEIERLKEHYENKLNIVHIDSHIEDIITQQFKVRTNPTIFFFDNNGKFISKLLYYHSAFEIMATYQ